jgi:hypothetical protein
MPSLPVNQSTNPDSARPHHSRSTVFFIRRLSLMRFSLCVIGLHTCPPSRYSQKQHSTPSTHQSIRKPTRPHHSRSKVFFIRRLSLTRFSPSRNRTSYLPIKPLFSPESTHWPQVRCLTCVYPCGCTGQSGRPLSTHPSSGSPSRAFASLCWWA